MADLKILPHACFANPGDNVWFVDDDTFVYVCGNGIKFVSSLNFKEQFLWGPVAKGASALTVHTNIQTRSGLVAFAVSVPQTEVHVYEYPKNTRKYILSGVEECEIADLSFSRDGQFIVAIGKLPSKKIYVWDLETGELLDGIVHDLPIFCSFCKFCPTDPTVICLGGPEGLYVCSITKTYEGHTLAFYKIDLNTIECSEDAARYSSGREIDDAMVKAIHWTPNGGMFVSMSNGDLLKLRRGSTNWVPELESRVVSGGPVITAMVLSMTDLICACDNSTINWLTLPNFEITQTLQLSSKHSTPGSLVPVCMAHSPTYEKLIVVTESGSLHEMSVDVEERSPQLPSLGGGSTSGYSNTDRDRSRQGVRSAPELIDCLSGPLFSASALMSTAPRDSSVALGGADGVLYIWDVGRKKLLCKVHLLTEEGEFVSTDLPPTPVSARPNSDTTSSNNNNNDNSNNNVCAPVCCSDAAQTLPLLAVGSTTGTLRILLTRRTTATRAAVSLMRRLKLFNGPIASVSFHPTLPLLACVGSNPKQVFIIDCSIDGGFWPVAVASLPSSDNNNPIAVFWTGNNKNLLVSCENKIVYTLNGESPEGQYQTSAIPKPPVDLSDKFEKYHMPRTISNFSHADASRLLMSSYEHKTLVTASSNISQWSQMESRPTIVEAFNTNHMKGTSCVIRARTESPLMVCGSLDGAVSIYRCGPGGPLKECLISRVHKSPIAAIALTNDCRYLVSAGIDGVCFCWELSGDALRPDAERAGAEELCPENVISTLEETCASLRKTNLPTSFNGRELYLNAVEELKLRNDMSIHEQAQSNIRFGITNVATKLQEMLQRNEQAPELERLDRKDFCIDFDRRDRLQTQNKQRAAELRETIEKSNLRNDIIRDRIKREFWDVAAVKRREIKSFLDSSASISNFKINVLSKEVDIARKLAVEKRTQEIAQKTETSESDVMVHDLPLPMESITSDELRKSQAVLVEVLVRSLKEEFNSKFDQLGVLKEEEVDRIKGKNKRMAEILSELRAIEDYFQPRWFPEEKPETVLEVTNAEIGFDPYISEEEREAARIAEEERRRQEAENVKDDAPERALMDMMGGTLEKKTDLSALEQDLPPPDFTLEEGFDELLMDEEQQKEMDNYLAKKAALESEKEKYCKELQLEFKKLKTEAADIARTFDEKVAALVLKRRECELEALAFDTYRLRLVTQLRERDAQRRTLKQYRMDYTKAHERASELEEKISEFKEEVETVRAQGDELAETERELDRGFRKDMQTCAGGALDQDTLKILTQLYRSRGGARRSSMRSSGRRSQSMARRSSYGRSRRSVARSIDRSSTKLSAMNAFKNKKPAPRKRVAALDPFQNVDAEVKKAVKSPIDQLNPLSREDVPEGFIVSDDMWNRLNACRIERIKLEMKTKEHGRTLQEMVGHISILQAEETEQRELASSLEQQIADLQITMQEHEADPVHLIKIKQGQDESEINSDGVHEHGSCSLLHNRAVDLLNQEIHSRGKSQVEILTRIKEFRKSIRVFQWEDRLAAAQEKDMEEHYTDLHMLRVTKSLQEFIQGGDMISKQKEDLQKADTKLTHLRSVRDQRLKKARRSLQKTNSELRRKQKENESLKDRLRELKASASVRETLQQSAGSDMKSQQARDNMKQIVARRRLIELARSQTDEIEFLRQELDRLRQQTFPSFAQAAVVNAGNVDDQAF